MTKRKEDSLKKRYLAKLYVSIILIPIGLIANSIIPRSLGPSAYGKFNFLTETFSKIVEFVEAGFAPAYYTKLSQNLNDKGIIRFFFGLRFIFGIITIIITSLVFVFNLQEFVWPNQEVKYIYMALFVSVLTLFSGTTSSTVDAFGLTVKGELVSLIQKIFGLGIILLLFFLVKLDMTIFFLYNYFIILILFIGNSFVLIKGGVQIFNIPRLTRIQIKKYILDFWKYSNPLIILSLISASTSFLDLWMLQKFSGSVQHGYYALAYKIAAITFLFSRAMTPLITREFSIAFGSKDITKMKILFERYIPMLYTIAAFLSVFLSVEASKVSLLYGGGEFKKASIALALMALYPIHQTYGQLSGSFFLATGQTKLYRNITSYMRIASLLLSFYLLAPASFKGLNLGASGLAIKMLIYQLILVNIQLFYNSKYLSMNFAKLFFHQIKVVGIFFLVATVTSFLSDFFISKIIISFIISGSLYLFLCGLMFYKYPSILSVSREEINKFKNMFFIRLEKFVSPKKKK